MARCCNRCNRPAWIPFFAFVREDVRTGPLPRFFAAVTTPPLRGTPPRRGIIYVPLRGGVPEGRGGPNTESRPSLNTIS